MKSFGHLFPFHCHRTHFTAHVPYLELSCLPPGFRFPGQGGQTVVGSHRDNIPTKAKNVSLWFLRERKCYLSKSRMLVNILSFLHARSKLLQHASAACEGTGQASKLSPTLRKHRRSHTLPKKAASILHKASHNLKKKKVKTEQSALILTTRQYNLTKYQIKASHKTGTRVVK